MSRKLGIAADRRAASSACSRAQWYLAAAAVASRSDGAGSLAHLPQQRTRPFALIE